jgi:hypothetical protein
MPVQVVCLPEHLASPTVGVGQYPKALSVVRGAGVVCSEHAPFRIEPEDGQGPENGVEAPQSEAWHVFQEHDSGSNVANDLRHSGPQPSIIGPAAALAGGAPWLTREPGMDEVDPAGPWSAVKGRDVVPNGGGGEASVVHSSDEDGGGVGVAFDVADVAEGWADGDVESEGQAPDSGTKRKAIHAAPPSRATACRWQSRQRARPPRRMARGADPHASHHAGTV